MGWTDFFNGIEGQKPAVQGGVEVNSLVEAASGAAEDRIVGGLQEVLEKFGTKGKVISKIFGVAHTAKSKSETAGSIVDLVQEIKEKKPGELVQEAASLNPYGMYVSEVFNIGQDVDHKFIVGDRKLASESGIFALADAVMGAATAPANLNEVLKRQYELLENPFVKEAVVLGRDPEKVIEMLRDPAYRAKIEDILKAHDNVEALAAVKKFGELETYRLDYMKKMNLFASAGAGMPELS